MKRIQKYFGFILAIIMAIVVMPAMPVYASGKVIVAVSASSLNIGDTVTVTGTAQGPGGEQVTATLGFNYDSSKFTFVSCSDSTYSGGGGGYVGVVGEKASITLKASAAGSASVSVSGSDGVIFSTGEEIGNLSAGGTAITINNAAGANDNNDNGVAGEDNANQSGDNSLSSINISPGTLSPAFKYSTTSYTASVGDDVTEIAVDAKTSNSKAKVESVTGNTDLKVGKNTVNIVVKAENGTTATYKIVVTRGGAAQEPEEKPEEKPEDELQDEDSQAITINGHDYNLAATIPADKIPEDFTKITVNCKGQDVEALQFDKGNVVLIYLTTPDTEVKNMLAIYVQESGMIYPFVKVPVGSNYYIVLNAPTETGLSDMYAATTVELGEYGTVPAYINQDSELNDFCLLYVISNSGNIGWYQYDKAEGTFQRYVEQGLDSSTDVEAANTDMKSLKNAYDKLNKQYNTEKSFARRTIAVLIFLIAVLVIVIVNLLLRGKKDEEEEEWENDFEKIPKRFSVTLEEEKKEQIEEIEKEEEKRIPKKKTPAEEPLAEEKDDFEVIDLDDL